MPELPDIAAYLSALEPRIVGQPIRANSIGQPLSASHRATASYQCRRPHCARTAANWQANRHWRGRRSLARAAPDDCRPTALAASRGKAGGTPKSGRFRFSQRLAGSHRSRHKTSRVVAMSSPARTACVPSTLAESMSSPAISLVSAALTAENRTLKRALTDPRIVSGIGNAYSDEILHRGATVSRSRSPAS